MAYDAELAGCFGQADLTFACHNSARDAAFLWLTKLREQETVWADVEAQIEEYLRERDAVVFHIIDQIDRAKRMLGPWLYGPVVE